MEFIIIMGLILLNGIFSLSEMALVSSRKFKLEQAKKKGMPGANAALELSENPTRFLSTVQIGITLIGILLGVYSGENLTNDVAIYIETISILQPYAYQISIGLIVLVVTYLSIVFGELLPKRIGMAYPEPIAVFFAKPMGILANITAPFVWLLAASNDMVLNLFGIRKTSDSKVSEEEIKSIIKESAQGGEIQDIEQNIVERVFELGDRKVNTLFTHRSDMVYFDSSENWEAVRAKINEEKHSAYPVCDDNDIDNIIGIVLLKDLFTPASDKPFDLRDYIKEPLYFNENMYAYKILELFKQRQMHYGIVVDEYGATMGIVTMDDVVDALVGDVTELDQEEYQITKRDDNSWLVDGQYSVIDFLKFFDLEMPDNFLDQYTTVAGLIIHLSGTLPNVGDKFAVDHYEMEVVDKDGQRVDKILVTRKK
ncbi:MAG: HlyC/CorC family transporter [Saprospiraceae bacterium]|nr:HlyC/CorC family transporter [Saprospiraceae bacterium]